MRSGKCCRAPSLLSACMEWPCENLVNCGLTAAALRCRFSFGPSCNTCQCAATPDAQGGGYYSNPGHSRQLWHGLKPEKMVWAIGLFAMVLMLKIIKVCRCVAGCLVDAFESLFAYLSGVFILLDSPRRREVSLSL
jgi:hypothetical protein